MRLTWKRTLTSPQSARCTWFCTCSWLGRLSGTLMDQSAWNIKIPVHNQWVNSHRERTQWRQQAWTGYVLFFNPYIRYTSILNGITILTSSTGSDQYHWFLQLFMTRWTLVCVGTIQGWFTEQQSQTVHDHPVPHQWETGTLWSGRTRFWVASPRDSSCVRHGLQRLTPARCIVCVKEVLCLSMSARESESL